jgi:hypothetical protein
MPRAFIFDSSVDAGTPSFSAAPSGPDTPEAHRRNPQGGLPAPLLNARHGARTRLGHHLSDR